MAKLQPGAPGAVHLAVHATSGYIFLAEQADIAAVRWCVVLAGTAPTTNPLEVVEILIEAAGS